MSRSITLAAQTQAPPASLYEAITTADGLRSFWVSDADAEATVGGALRFGFAEAPVDLTMTVAALEPDSSVRWADIGPWPSWTGTEVSWSIVPMEEGTGVLFVHSGFADDVADFELGMIASTWAQVLGALTAYAEGGAPAPALG